MQDDLELHYSPEDSTQTVQLFFMCIVKVLITLQGLQDALDLQYSPEDSTPTKDSLCV